MAKGRKKTPDQLKVIRGTFRADRANKEAPIPDPDGPRAPTWLPKEARECFGVLKSRIEDLGLASKTYTEMLALAALRIAEIEELNEIIEREGRTCETLRGGLKNRPEVGQRNEAFRHLQSLLSEFGLSPASIGKTKLLSPQKGKGKKGFGAFNS